MSKNLTQPVRYGLASQASIVREGDKAHPFQSRPSFREDTPNFRALRSIAHDKKPAAVIVKKSSSLERYPRCYHVYQKYKSIQKVIYLFLEEPTTSKLAMAFFVLIIIAIIFSTFHAILSSAFGTNDSVQQVEFAISVLFIIEYGLRLLSATAFGEKFFAVVLKPLNLLDIVGILPFFLELILNGLDEGSINFSVLRIVRLAKIVRVLRLGRYLQGAEVFYHGLKASVSSFGFLGLVIAVVNVIGATALYYAENQPLDIDNLNLDNPEHMSNLAQAMWYVLVTIATVGYGDYIPQTLLGKIIATVIAVIGMLLYSLPVAILGNNFQKTYNQKLEEDNIRIRKESKFKEHSSLSESQKEILFMNERILSIENTNRAIVKIINDSEENYNEVAKKLKNLYESIFADEETLAKKEESKRRFGVDFSGSGFIGAKMETRIKLYEKLNRAKRKIDLAVLFKKKTPVLASDMEIAGQTIKENKPTSITHAMKSYNSMASGMSVSQVKARGRIQSDAHDVLNVSDIVETEGGAFSSEIPVMASRFKTKQKDRYKAQQIEYCQGESEEGAATASRDSEIDWDRVGRRSNRTIIKSHSMDRANSFLAYYVRNLSFIPPALLEELAAEDTTESSDEEDVDEGPHLLKPPLMTATNDRRRASVSGVSNFMVSSKNPEKVKRKREQTTRIIDITKPGKFVPKNYDKRIWELTGKILESMEQKAKLGNSMLVVDKPFEKSEEMLQVEKAIEMARNEIQRLMKIKENIANKEFEIRTQQSLKEYERQSTQKITASPNLEKKQIVLSPLALLKAKQPLIPQEKPVIEEIKTTKPIETKQQTTENDGKETQRETRINFLESEMPHIREEDENSFMHTGRSTMPMLRKNNDTSSYTLSTTRKT